MKGACRILHVDRSKGPDTLDQAPAKGLPASAIRGIRHMHTSGIALETRGHGLGDCQDLRPECSIRWRPGMQHRDEHRAAHSTRSHRRFQRRPFRSARGPAPRYAQERCRTPDRAHRPGCWPTAGTRPHEPNTRFRRQRWACGGQTRRLREHGRRADRMLALAGKSLYGMRRDFPPSGNGVDAPRLVVFEVINLQAIERGSPWSRLHEVYPR